MKYEILYPEAFPVVKCQLEQGERLKAESDAMITMSATVDVEGKMTGGILSGLARKFLTGESFFCQELVASRGPGEVMLGHALPGGIVALPLTGSYGWIVEKGGYMASTEGIEVDTKMQNLSHGLFSGQGFFVLRIKGTGTLFVSSFGVIHPVELGEGEEVIIDNGNLVAWPDYMDYTIEKASNGWLSGIKSGECLVTRFRGPGTVLIQTRNPSSFEAWIRSMIPTN